jgi:ATP-dependent RNA helicase DHX29
VLSTAQENWTPPADTSLRSEDEVCEFSVITKGHHDDGSFVLHEPSQADWIRQYMEREDEVGYCIITTTFAIMEFKR